MRDVKDESVHLVVTSPPYFNLVTYAGSEGQLGHIDGYEEFLDELDAVWAECRRVLIPGGRMCIVVGDVCLSRRQAGRHHVLPLSSDITVRARGLGFDSLNGIHWQKVANIRLEGSRSSRFLGKPNQPNGIVKNDIERILLFRKPGPYRSVEPGRARESWIDTDSYSRWFTHTWSDIPGARRSAHPAPFPLEIPMRLVQMFSFQGETVLDPFAGTGTTALAALKTGRNSVGYDIEPDYIDLALERLRDQKPLAAVETARGVGRPVKSAA